MIEKEISDVQYCYKSINTQDLQLYTGTSQAARWDTKNIPVSPKLEEPMHWAWNTKYPVIHIWGIPGSPNWGEYYKIYGFLMCIEGNM